MLSTFLAFWVDIGTDVFYVLTTPMTTEWLGQSITILMILPFTFSLTSWILSFRAIREEDEKDLTCESICEIVTQLTGCAEIRAVYKGEDDKESTSQKVKNNCLFFFTEDSPQLNLQVYNSIVVGQTLSITQVVSPVSAIIQVFMRTDGFDKVKKESRFLSWCFVITQGITLIPMFVFLLLWSGFGKEHPAYATPDVVPRVWKWMQEEY